MQRRQTLAAVGTLLVGGCSAVSSGDTETNGGDAKATTVYDPRTTTEPTTTQTTATTTATRTTATPTPTPTQPPLHTEVDAAEYPYQFSERVLFHVVVRNETDATQLLEFTARHFIRYCLFSRHCGIPDIRELEVRTAFALSPGDRLKLNPLVMGLKPQSRDSVLDEYEFFLRKAGTHGFLAGTEFWGVRSGEEATTAIRVNRGGKGVYWAEPREYTLRFTVTDDGGTLEILDAAAIEPLEATTTTSE